MNKSLNLLMFLLSAGCSWGNSFQISDSASWSFPVGSTYAAIGGDRLIGSTDPGSTAFLPAIPTQGATSSGSCLPSLVRQCASAITIDAFNSLPSALNYGSTVTASGSQSTFFGPGVEEDGETRLKVSVMSTNPITIPIPTLDCYVQTTNASAGCAVATSAIQPPASSYINSYRGVGISGSGTADLTATSLVVTGSDYDLGINFHQGNFTDPGTDATISIVAVGGVITQSQFVNPGVNGGLPLPPIFLPALGSSSSFSLAFPAIPSLAVDPNFSLSYIEMDQFLTGQVAAATVPEPGTILLLFSGLGICATGLYRKRDA